MTPLEELEHWRSKLPPMMEDERNFIRAYTKNLQVQHRLKLARLTEQRPRQMYWGDIFHVAG